MNTAQIRNQVKQYIDQLSPEHLEFVSDFLDYLVNKKNKKINQNNQTEIDANINALELAGDLVGCLEAPEDLSTNKDYFKGFGEL